MTVYLKQVNALIIGLLAICTLLALYGFFRVGNIHPPEPRLLNDAALAVQSIEVETELMVIEQLQQRPLFWNSRRPYVPPVVESEPAAVPEPTEKPDPASTVFKGTRLLGLYAGGARPGVILLHNEERLRLSQYEALQGWTLDALGDNWAEFVNDDERFRLEIQYPSVKFTSLPVTD
jgi:hypothetical protein